MPTGPQSEPYGYTPKMRMENDFCELQPSGSMDKPVFFGHITGERKWDTRDGRALLPTRKLLAIAVPLVEPPISRDELKGVAANYNTRTRAENALSDSLKNRSRDPLALYEQLLAQAALVHFLGETTFEHAMQVEERNLLRLGQGTHPTEVPGGRVALYSIAPNPDTEISLMSTVDELAAQRK